MPKTSLRFFRRFAPAALAASLLFLAVSDAGASCLAAWLCPPPAAADCAGSHSAGDAWQAAPAGCSFEARVDRAFRKLDPVQLLLLDGVVAPSSLASPRSSARAHRAGSGSVSDLNPPPTLHRLQAPLLI